jgi:hypothetical protein
MAHKVQVNVGRVALPDGNIYSAGTQVILTSAQFAVIPAAAFTSILTDLGLAVDTSSADLVATGLLAAQPSATTFGKGFYFATDDNGGTQYYSNGTIWTRQAPGIAQAATPSYIGSQTLASNFSIPASVAANTPSDVTGLSITFTAVAGATYWVRLKSGVYVTTVGHQGLLWLRDGTNNVLELSGTGVSPSAGWSCVPLLLEAFTNPGAGSITYKASLGYDATSAAGSTAVIAGTGYGPRLSVLRVA